MGLRIGNSCNVYMNKWTSKSFVEPKGANRAAALTFIFICADFSSTFFFFLPFTLVLFLQNVLMIRVLDARRKNPLFWFLCPFTCIETKIIFIYTSICPHLRYEIFVRYNQLWWLYISQIRFIQFVEIKFKNLKQSSGFPNYDLCSPFPPREGGGGRVNEGPD